MFVLKSNIYNMFCKTFVEQLHGLQPDLYHLIKLEAREVDVELN